MPPALDAEGKAGSTTGPRPVETHGEFGEGSGDVDHANGFGGRGHFAPTESSSSCAMSSNRPSSMRKARSEAEAIFDSSSPSSTVEKRIAPAMVWRWTKVSFHGSFSRSSPTFCGTSTIVADHVVVLDPQRPAPGLRRVARLKGGDEAAGILLQLAQLVEIGVVGRPDEPAIALEQRQFVGERGGERVGDRVRSDCSVRAASASSAGRSAASRVQRAKFARREQSVAHAGQIARTAAPETKTRERARQIGRALEDAPDAARADRRSRPGNATASCRSRISVRHR